MKEDSRPLMVTIQCCTYNHENYIRQCLDGFIMQKTNVRFEAIVHDDASTDGTASIIHEYAEKYPDIIKPIYETENQYSKRDGSLTRIMDEHTHGKYIAICEGDDYWIDPLKLQKQVDILEENCNIGLCYTDAYIYNQSKSVLRKRNDRREYINTKALFRHNPIYTLTTLYRTKLYRNYCEEVQPNLRNWKIGDLPIWIWISLHADVFYINNVTSVYRELTNSASHNEKLESMLDFIMSVYKVHLFFHNQYFAEDVQLRRTIENRKNRRLAHLYAKHHNYKLFLQYYMAVKPKSIGDWLHILFLR